MKIYPRVVSIEEGKESYELNIRNSAEDDRILLFKIRRSEHKMMEFTPKMGYVEPGQTSKVTLRLIDHSIPKTRLLVKLVVMKKSMLESEFEQSWNAASKRNGEVKKVIDIVNMHAPGAQEVLGAHTPQTHKRNAAKHHMMLNRIRSTDSDAVSAMSDASALSLQQSAASAGFYSPSVSAMSSPTHSERETGHSFSIHSPDGGHFTTEAHYYTEGSPDVHNDGHQHHHRYDHEQDNFSVADSVADESVDMNSYSQSESLSQSQHLQLEHATAALLQQRTAAFHAPLAADHRSVAAAPSASADAANDGAAAQQKALMDALIKLAQTPNTATLLSQLLLSVGQGQSHGQGASAHSHAGQPQPHSSHHPPKSPVARTNKQLGIAYHDTSVADRNPIIETCSGVSSAEQTRRFIEGDQAEFPSIKETQATNQVAPTSEPSLHDCSRLAALSSNDQRSRARGNPADGADARGHSPRGAYVLELFGAEVSNQNFAHLVEQRMEQATSDKGKVVAIEVMSAGISDLSVTLGRIFTAGSKSSKEQASADPLHQLRTLRAAYLEDNLKHVTVNHCPVQEVDISINRFRCLTTLNLSNNSIRTLAGPLDLPQLRSLDLSGNHLTSLDYLQMLVSLTTLLAGGNDITSLNLSVNMLVSLSKTLMTLDLSSNPVCDDQHYAQQVLHALPRLRYFDSFDLQQMGKNYSYTYQRAGSTSRRAAADSKVGGVGGRTRSASTGRQSRLPDLPDEVRSVRSVSSSSSTLSRADRRSEFERRLNTAIGLRQRHPARSVHSPPSTEPAAGKMKHSARPQRNDKIRSKADTHHQPERNMEQNESEGDGDDDDDLEIQSVEDSIHQLSSSLRHSRPTKAGADVQAGDARASLSPNTDTVPLNISTTKSVPGSTRRSPSPPLIQHWAGAGATQRELSAREALLSVPPIDEASGLLEPTMAIKNRQAYFGVANRRQRFPEHNPNTSYCTTYSTATLGSSADWGDQGRGRSRSRSRSPGCSVNMSVNRSQNLNQLDQHDQHERGYFSEGDLGTSRTSRANRSRTGARRMATVTSLNEEQFLQMQEEEKYGMWHPRYRVPKPIFGFSRPFIHRRTLHLKDHAPLFNTTVQRLRDSFRKAPARGTFSRAGKGLPGDWYPMDYADLEAIRRQGYFHETIGEVTKDSYKDANSNSSNLNLSKSQSQSQPLHQQSTSSGVPRFLQEALVSPKGSVSLTPDKKGRRQSWGPHMSRYDPAVSAIHLSDDFSGFRKWHQGLFDGDGELDVPAATGTNDFDRSAFSATSFSASPPSSSKSDGAVARSSDGKDVGSAVAAAEKAVREMQACFDGEEGGDGEDGDVDDPASEAVTSAAGTSSVQKAPSPQRFGSNSNSQLDQPVPSPQYDHSPKDLGRAAHGHSRERLVTLLPMEPRDSGELRASSALDAPYSPSSSFTTSFAHPNKQDHLQSQQQSVDASFADDLRMFEALPSFPADIEASLNRYEMQVNQNYGASSEAYAVPASKKSAFQVPSPIKPAPPSVVYQDMSEQIAAEEAELSNYLSWLENQHRGGPPTAPATTSAAPSSNNINGTASSGPAGISKASASPSGIPRYSQSPSQQQQRNRQGSSLQQPGQSTILKLRSSMNQDEVHYSDETRVFSPRDAAMRAEQQERAESEERLFFEQGNNSKSSAAMRSLFR